MLFLKHPAKYFKDAASETKNVRKIAIAALMIALSVAIKPLFIPIQGNDLKVMFQFIPLMIGAAIYGPFVAVFSGFISDIVGHLIFPSGAFFWGYTISAMAGGLIYGLCLYKTKLSLLHIILAKFLVNMLVNVGLGPVWRILCGAAPSSYPFLLTTSTVKNLLILPLEVYIIYMTLRTLLPLLVDRQLIERIPRDEPPLWQRIKSKLSHNT